MNRFFVPIVFVLMISGLGFGLIVGVVAGSPETHANVRPEGYDRTPISYLGEEFPFEGIGLADPQIARTGDTVQDGRLLFFQFGCASCHGFSGSGGAVGPDLSWAGGLAPAELARLLKGEPQDVPPGMPYFGTLSDEDIETLSAFLRWQFP